MSSAPPLDVRKVFDLPEYWLLLFGAMPKSNAARLSLAEVIRELFGKAKPFRISGGKAETESCRHAFIELHSQIVV